MDESQSREILGDTIKANNSLDNLGPYIGWSPEDTKIVLDGHFTLEELEAVVWWVKNKVQS